MKNLNPNVIFVSVIASIFLVFFIPNNSETKNISVTGRCSRKVPKDKFSVSVRIKNFEKEASLAMNKTLSTYNQISEFIKEKQKTNPDLEVQTTEYTTNEKKEWNNVSKKSERVGVEGIISLQIITSNPELISQMIFDFGKFNDVYTSNFSNFISDTSYNKETRDCIKDAVLDAKHQADVMALSVGQSIGKMIYANYHNNARFSNRAVGTYKMALNMDAEATAEPATIFSNSQKIDVSVDVQFELK